MNDPVDEFLNADFRGEPRRELHQDILAKTLRSLRRKRWGRRLAKGGALAACFLAGMITMGVWDALPTPELNVEIMTGPILPLTKPPETPPEPPPTLVDLEWRAFDSRENRSALFFQVAQRYLEEQQDYESALRCYRQALDAAGQEELAIRPDDNWLVMALKEARQKEKNDALINP